MDPIHPRWAPWSYLLYAGAFVLLAAAGGLLAWFSSRYGAFKYTILSFVVFAGFAFVARSLRRDGGHPIAAGLFAFAAAVLFGAFVLAAYSWFGWEVFTGSAFGGFNLARLTLVLLALWAALVALRLFRFPLLVLLIAALSWFFVTDFVSGGGDWSAIVTFVVGFGFLGWARVFDSDQRRPYGFWLHVSAGLTIGGSLLFFLHHGHFEWALIVVGGLLFVKLADSFDRASWAVFGSIGILAAATHFATAFSHESASLAGGISGGGSRGWVPSVVFGVAGVLLVALGGLLAGRRRTGSVSG
jgi:hypothetical protein